MIKSTYLNINVMKIIFACRKKCSETKESRWSAAARRPGAKPGGPGDACVCRQHAASLFYPYIISNTYLVCFKI